MASTREQMIRAVQRVQQPLMRRIRAIASRATVGRVDDAGRLQAVQISVLAGERLDNVQRLQQFGHSGMPPAGSTCLLISIGGSRTHCVVIGGEDNSRPRDLASGESQLYNSTGDFVWLKTSGEMVLKAASSVTIDSPMATFTGDVHVQGELHVDGAISSDTSVADPSGSMQEMRSDYNPHTHPGGGAPTPQMT